MLDERSPGNRRTARKSCGGNGAGLSPIQYSEPLLGGTWFQSNGFGRFFAGLSRFLWVRQFCLTLPLAFLGERCLDFLESLIFL
jgi:hypothetical protein